MKNWMIMMVLVMAFKSPLITEPSLSLDHRPLKPIPWEPSFPRDPLVDKLTKADWLGPDGIIYPNWTWAGVHLGQPGQRQAGIPTVIQPVAHISSDLNGFAQAEAFTSAMEQAIERVGTTGGGVIQIPSGTYTLIRPIIIRYPKIIIRGAGRGTSAEPGGRNDNLETRIIYAFAGDEKRKISILTQPSPSSLSKVGTLHFFAPPFAKKASAMAKVRFASKSHIQKISLRVSMGGNVIKKLEKKLYPTGPASSWSWPSAALLENISAREDITITPTVHYKYFEDRPAGREQHSEILVGTPQTYRLDQWDTRHNEALTHNQPDTLDMNSAFSFIGNDKRLLYQRVHLLRTAKRGDTSVLLAYEDLEHANKLGIKPGALVQFFCYESQSFADAIERDGNKAVPRKTYFTVLSMEKAEEAGIWVHFEQALQMDFPANEGQVERWSKEHRRYVRDGQHSTFAQVVRPIVECAIENLVIEQASKMWFSGVRISNGLNCWIKNIRVEKAGRNPIWVTGMMNEVRDSEFVDPIYANHTGGGSGYISGSSYSLFDNLYMRNTRHGPNFSGDTAGVFRNSRAQSSDLQWHMWWGVAHLIENVSVDALMGTGSYGYGAFAQRNIMGIHGPGMGPRNCIYNCDFQARKGGAFFGGKSEGLLFLHNRLRVFQGPGIILRYHIFNSSFIGNNIGLMNPFEPGVLFGDPDPNYSRLASGTNGVAPPIHPALGTANLGNDFLHNHLYGGSGSFEDGSIHFWRMKSDWRKKHGNQRFPWTWDVPKPQPAMVSVFDMQRLKPEGFSINELQALKVPLRTFTEQSISPRKLSEEKRQLICQINFGGSDQLSDDPKLWSGQTPKENWWRDRGQTFEMQQGPWGQSLEYGWIDGTPHESLEDITWYRPLPDIRIRTLVRWKPSQDFSPVSQWNSPVAKWAISLPPGSYKVFLLCGSINDPQRYSWPDQHAQPYLQNNSFIVNGQKLEDPEQSDVGQDAYWFDVDIDNSKRLTIQPASHAIGPSLSLIKIYRD